MIGDAYRYRLARTLREAAWQRARAFFVEGKNPSYGEIVAQFPQTDDNAPRFAAMIRRLLLDMYAGERWL